MHSKQHAAKHIKKETKATILMPASVYRHLVPGLPSTEAALSLEHLRPSQLKMLLQGEGLDMEGSREQLLARLKAHLVDSLPTEWVMTALEGARGCVV